MRWVEGVRRFRECGAFVVLLLAGFAHADAPAYGKVETFQPGKKYDCVPTPDHKAWDCSESGKPAEQSRRESPPAPQPASNQAPAEPVPKASALPSYLTNAAASRRGATSPAAASAPAASAPADAPRTVSPQAQVQTKPVAKTAPSSAAAAEKSPAPPPPAEPPPTAAAEPSAKPAAVARSTASVAQANNAFANLPGDQYVLELAHADNAALDAPAVPRGKVYKLHLRQNGAEHWLLLWGPFDSIESARAARDEIAAQGVTSGWPRRIAPLQAEARRATE